MVVERIAARKWWLGALGLVIVGAAAAQPPLPKVDPVKPAAGIAPTPVDPIKAIDPVGGLLADGKAAYAKARDYTCTFTRQERLAAVLGAEQVAEMKVRVNPAAIAIRFARPEATAGMELVYPAARQFGKVKFRPAGVKGASTVLTLNPDDPKVLGDNRHAVTAYGIGPVLDRLAGIMAREKALNNPVEAYTSDYQFAGKTVTRYELFTRRPHASRYAFRMLVYVDRDTKLPVRFEAYDAPKAGATVGELLEAYSFTDVKFNVGLGDAAFE